MVENLFTALTKKLHQVQYQYEAQLYSVAWFEK
jgi:hypothetical protein